MLSRTKRYCDWNASLLIAVNLLSRRTVLLLHVTCIELDIDFAETWLQYKAVANKDRGIEISLEEQASERTSFGLMHVRNYRYMLFNRFNRLLYINVDTCRGVIYKMDSNSAGLPGFLFPRHMDMAYDSWTNEAKTSGSAWQTSQCCWFESYDFLAWIYQVKDWWKRSLNLPTASQFWRFWSNFSHSQISCWCGIACGRTHLCLPRECFFGMQCFSLYFRRGPEFVWLKNLIF